MIMKKWQLIFLINLLLKQNNFFAQEKKTDVPPFDKAACKADALKGGMDESELPGYLKFKEAMYYAQYKKITHTVNTNEGLRSTSNNPACYNMNLETQTFDGWVADTGRMTNNTGKVTIYQPGFSTSGINASVFDPFARQTIITEQPTSVTVPVMAPYTGYDLRLTKNLGVMDKAMPLDSTVTVVAPGTLVSVRLGNALGGAQTERLSKTFIVDANNESFTYSYAVMLEDPVPTATPHNAQQRPRFTIRVLDTTGQVADPCSFYEVYSGKDSSYINSYDTVCGGRLYPDTCGNTIYNFKPWTTVGMDLSAHRGKQITIEFTTRDCSHGGHFGYAYLNARCSAFEIGESSCEGRESIDLIAPVGYTKYIWKDANGNIVGTEQKITVVNAKQGDHYSVQMTAVTGCVSLLKTQIKILPDPNAEKYQLANVFTPNGDNINDLFKTSQLKLTSPFNIQIYDRWGLKVFESEEPDWQWDGTVNNAPASDGLYFWILKYQSVCDFEEHKEIVRKGFVHLIR